MLALIQAYSGVYILWYKIILFAIWDQINFFVVRCMYSETVNIKTNIELSPSQDSFQTKSLSWY